MAFVYVFYHSGGVATEVGKRAFKFHLQGVFEVRYPVTAPYQKQMGEHIIVDSASSC